MNTTRNAGNSPIPNAKRTEYFDHEGKSAYVEWELLDVIAPGKAVAPAGSIAVITGVGRGANRPAAA